MSFTAELGVFRLKSLAKVEQVRKAIIFKLFGAVVMDTPVLTGRLRGNWQVTIGNPATGTLDRTDKSGATVMSEISRNLGNGDCVVNLTNNLPYAARIEFDGWSHTKAPEGMMRRNVVRINELIKAQARKA